MNWKKIILIFIIFLTIIGTGSILSNVQSKEANQLLETHGLSNNTRYFTTNSKQTISFFLKYIDKNFHKEKIQFHFDSKINRDQVLVWANRNVLSMSTDTGRFFTLDDFSGRVSFAVLGPNAQVKVMETQGNKYIHINDQYYTVIGELKKYHQIEENKYYLSTGIDQPTAKGQLRDYRIIIDSSNPVIKKVAKHYHAKTSVPAFVRNHQIHSFSVIKEILLIFVVWLVAMVCNALIALIHWHQIKLTNLKHSFFNNWFINRFIRLVLTESLLAFISYIVLYSTEFFKGNEHLIMLIVANLLVGIFAYIATWGYLNKFRKKR